MGNSPMTKSEDPGGERLAPRGYPTQAAAIAAGGDGETPYLLARTGKKEKWVVAPRAGKEGDADPTQQPRPYGVLTVTSLPGHFFHLFVSSTYGLIPLRLQQEVVIPTVDAGDDLVIKSRLYRVLAVLPTTEATTKNVCLSEEGYADKGATEGMHEPLLGPSTPTVQCDYFGGCSADAVVVGLCGLHAGTPKWTSAHLDVLDHALGLVMGKTMTQALAARIINHLLVHAPALAKTDQFVKRLADQADKAALDRIQLEPSEAPTLDTSPEPLDFGIDNIASTPAGQCGADHCFAKAVGGLDLCAVHTDVLLAMDLGGDS